MKIIEKLSEEMEEELNDAEKYIECAMKWKNDVLLSKMYADMSADELKHALMLHESGVRLINEYKQEGKEAPVEMQAVYDYIHERNMDKYNRIKLQQAMFKG